MDWWPNVDAVIWFADEILPLIVQERQRQATSWGAPTARYERWRETAASRDRAGRGRQAYLQHSRVVVAPMHCTGIGTKCRGDGDGAPVVVSAAAAALSVLAGWDLDIADGAMEFARTVKRWNPSEARPSAPRRDPVMADYDWARNLAPFDLLLQDPAPALRQAAI
jgi:hypothetical protein